LTKDNFKLHQDPETVQALEKYQGFAISTPDRYETDQSQLGLNIVDKSFFFDNYLNKQNVVKKI
jgi:hypothetical protein